MQFKALQAANTAMAARSAILLVALLLLAAPRLQPVSAVYLCVYCYRYSNGARTRLTVVLNDRRQYACKWKGKKKRLLHIYKDLMLCPETVTYKGEEAPCWDGTLASGFEPPSRVPPLHASDGPPTPPPAPPPATPAMHCL